MRYVIVDTEVFAYDNIVVFKDYETKERSIYHNDNDSVREYLEQPDVIYVTANGKHYDQYILKAIACDFSPEEVKLLNDFIINDGGEGWEYPPLRNEYFNINICDLFDDMQQGLSLKAIEGHLGMDIEETEVDFNINRPLTRKETELTIQYCCFDVDATERLFDLRKGYIDNKLYLGAIAGILPEKALYMTNAKLTAAYLKAKPVSFDDERNYKYPNNLLREYIPKEVIDFFNHIYNKSLSDKEIFTSKIKINIGECPVTIGFGGIHGAIPTYREKEKNRRIIRNYDVASYYPHLMTIMKYCSRAIPDPKDYEIMLDERMKAKKSGDKKTANALKLVANTTYGAMLNRYNALYDPLMGRSVCITGQLFLLELAEHLVSTCNKLKIIQLNTDGIMISFDDSEYPIVTEIVNEWQRRTGFELEKDCISEIIQKDVNNYIELPTGGIRDDNGNPRWKLKGGYLVKGVASAGAFNVNNNARIVATAIVNYFVENISVDETINACNDPLQFQFIAKAGSKYSGVFHTVNGEKVPVQKVNRVYASKDKNFGTLYHIHAEMGTVGKISNIPTHCIVDNKNSIDINDIDKKFYVRMADNQIKDFLGISRKVKRTNTRTINKIKKSILAILEEN